MAKSAFRATALASLYLCAAPAFAGGTAEPSGAVDPVPAAIDEVGIDAEAGRERLGVVRLFVNDRIGILFGDRYDRWRSGSFSVSAIYGRPWQESLPSTPFDVMEYRLRGEIIAPDNLAAPAPTDRLYASSWWLGAHTHFDWRGFDVAAGLDLVVAGPQTGLMGFQDAVHDVFGEAPVNLEWWEIENGTYLNGTVEMARDVPLGFGSLRPFVEVQAGVETFARTGFDLTIGQMGDGGLRVRDPVTGHRIAAIPGLVDSGWSFLLGADAAWVDSSVFLPSSRGYEVEDTRYRVRAGVNYALGDSNFFYGVSYLSEEFVNQPEGQVTGALSIDIRF